MSGAICGASLGKYGKPIPFLEAGVNFVDDNYNPVLTEPTEKYPCEHDKHWQWGRGTRNGQKLYFPLKEMFYQKWDLTKKELNQALDSYDMFSLGMPSRLICKECMKKL